VVVIRRSFGAGYGNIANSMYELPQTAMVFGDAKLALKGSGNNKGQVFREVLLILT
jgi:NAD/NADP transhydrogenase beta subunit